MRAPAAPEASAPRRRNRHRPGQRIPTRLCAASPTAPQRTVVTALNASVPSSLTMLNSGRPRRSSAPRTAVQQDAVTPARLALADDADHASGARLATGLHILRHAPGRARRIYASSAGDGQIGVAIARRFSLAAPTARSSFLGHRRESGSPRSRRACAHHLLELLFHPASSTARSSLSLLEDLLIAAVGPGAMVIHLSAPFHDLSPSSRIDKSSSGE